MSSWPYTTDRRSSGPNRAVLRRGDRGLLLLGESVRVMAILESGPYRIIYTVLILAGFAIFATAVFRIHHVSADVVFSSVLASIIGLCMFSVRSVFRWYGSVYGQV